MIIVILLLTRLHSGHTRAGCHCSLQEDQIFHQEAFLLQRLGFEIGNLGSFRVDRNPSSTLRLPARTRAARCNGHNWSSGHPLGSSSFRLLSVQPCLHSLSGRLLSLICVCVTFLLPQRVLGVLTCKVCFVVLGVCRLIWVKSGDTAVQKAWTGTAKWMCAPLRRR